jgi:hypothetical protein
MGLDMYFTGKRYLYTFLSDEKSRNFKNEISGIFPEMAGYNPSCVEYEIMSWRKANAIHLWFVNNIQDGVDECQESYVDPEQLHNLRDLCERVLKNPDKAGELLPTNSGFFFGGKEYDEQYLRMIHDTNVWLRGFLTRYSLNDYTGWDFYYRASW